MPSAFWNGRFWTDEVGIEYPATGPAGIRRCPRRVGIVPTSRAIFECDDARELEQLTFECIIVDEAHNARRQNLGPDRDAERPDPNNLLAFLYTMSTRTRSMLLATATPVQLRPVEAWDLLDVLARGSESVLGGPWSRWRRAEAALDLFTGRVPLPVADTEVWDWVRSPLPPRRESKDYEILRRSLGIGDQHVTANGSDWERLGEPDRHRIRKSFRRFVDLHNPFIRHIVRRSRKYLEETIDPETNEPYLKPIRVELLGEGGADAIALPLYLQEAYDLAEEFCRALGERGKSTGFLRTLLLRRVGSSIAAGRATAERLLATRADDADEDDASSEEADGLAHTLTSAERDILGRFVKALEANQDRDPKYAVVLDCLRRRGWLARGCIIFSQYFDSIDWLARELGDDFPDEPIAVYAGGVRSGIWQRGSFTAVDREVIKARVRDRKFRLLLGTDAASEGLNLQRMATLINLDLPWNPTRLEQRKGRIQRIGQLNDTVSLYNMRYVRSVEDRVHQLLSARLQGIFELFGQIPDVLEDVWIETALGQIEKAKQLIAAIPDHHPFALRYQRIERTDWESCADVLNDAAKWSCLTQPW